MNTTSRALGATQLWATDMAQTYKSQILHEWSWPEVVADSKANANHEVTTSRFDVPECVEGCDEDGHVGYSYLGRHYFMFPSQKFYAPWSAVSTDDRDADQRYATALDAVADQFGGWIESGEGDPTDVYFSRYWTCEELGIANHATMND
jgi:hypothetical protein